MCRGINPGGCSRKLNYSCTKASMSQTNKTEELGNRGENSYSLKQQSTRLLFANQHKALTAFL